MKLNDLVSFRYSRAHRVGYGVLTEIDLVAGTGVIMRNGVRYVRVLKRIKPQAVGVKAAAAKRRLVARRGWR